MAAEASIVKQYEDADFSKRVDIMLDNYASFATQIEICFEGIKYRIKEDRAFTRRQEKGDLGVRVQASGTSNPTEREALENIEIDEALKKKDFSGSIFKNVDDVEAIKREIYIMEIMRLDYQMLILQIKLLKKKDQKLLQDYLVNGMALEEIADAENVAYETIRTRIKRAKSRVKCSMVSFLDQNGRRDF